MSQLSDKLMEDFFGKLNPISTGGGGVFHPQFLFACNFFVLQPISLKFGNFPKI